MRAQKLQPSNWSEPKPDRSRPRPVPTPEQIASAVENYSAPSPLYRPDPPPAVHVAASVKAAREQAIARSLKKMRYGGRRPRKS